MPPRRTWSIETLAPEISIRLAHSSDQFAFSTTCRTSPFPVQDNFAPRDHRQMQCTRARRNTITADIVLDIIASCNNIMDTTTAPLPSNRQTCRIAQALPPDATARLAPPPPSFSYHPIAAYMALYTPVLALGSAIRKSCLGCGIGCQCVRIPASADRMSFIDFCNITPADISFKPHVLIPDRCCQHHARPDSATDGIRSFHPQFSKIGNDYNTARLDGRTISDCFTVPLHAGNGMILPLRS